MRRNRRNTIKPNNGPLMIEFNRRAENVDSFIRRATKTPDADTDIKYMIQDLKSMVHHINEMVKHGDSDCIEAMVRLSDVGYDLLNVGRPVYDKWANYAYTEYDKIEDQLVP